MLFKTRGTKNLCKNRGLLDAYGGPDVPITEVFYRLLKPTK